MNINMVDDITEQDISAKEIESSRVFGPLPDARPIQKNLASQYPLDAGVIGKIKHLSEGRSYPSATPESLFPYYLNNYEVTRRHLEDLRSSLDRPLKILEVGCGTGWGSKYIKDNLPDSEIIATNRVANDKDKITLETARNRFAVNGLNFEEADATKLLEQFGKESFDAVVMLEVIEHIPQELQARVAEEVSRVLRPGGEFLISTPAAEGYGQTVSGPQSKDHVWIYGNRQDISNTMSPHFPNVQVNRIVNPTHTHTFGGNAIRQHFYSFGVIKAPEQMFTQYAYEEGNPLTDGEHAKDQDTCTWYVVGSKSKNNQTSTEIQN